MDIGIGKAVLDLAVGFLKNKLAATGRREADIRVSIERHLMESLRWSERQQFYGMSKAEETDATTIPLNLAEEPRRFRSLKEQQTHRENELLLNPGNYVLLGDPGAGKTTTLKRLTQRVILGEPLGESDIYELPVVIRLREIGDSMGLFDKIARELDIPITTRPSYAPNAEAIPYEFWVGRERLANILLSFFDESAAILLLDGLDEVVPAARDMVDAQLTWLARNLRRGKVIVSCRSGDYAAQLDGFDVLEICPLTGDDIRSIARIWLGDPEQFLSQLQSLPYNDLLDRPLLLAQLLFIFKRDRYLPEQPNQVYAKVVSLMLREWDAERKVTRKSRYSAFTSERKAAFLAGIAYHLTYRTHTKTFSSQQLSAAYGVLCGQFGLPAAEMVQVVEEIETHTGIIVAAARGTYEFSHFSLQEYLCAEYLVHQPMAERLLHYFAELPGPVAVAATLSYDPGAWFAALILRLDRINVGQSMQSFLARLLVERPFFGVSQPLGVAIMKLHQEARDAPELRELLDRLIDLPNVRESIVEALQYFVPVKSQLPIREHDVSLTAVRALSDARSYPMPRLGSVPGRVLVELAEQRHPVGMMMYDALMR